MPGDLPDGHEPARLQSIVERVAGDAAPLRFRSMFGGIMCYAHDKPFASLSNRGLALKLAPHDSNALLAAGGRRLQYHPTDPPSTSYVLVAEPMLDDDDALRPWLVASAAFVAAAPVKRRARSSPA